MRWGLASLRCADGLPCGRNGARGRFSGYNRSAVPKQSDHSAGQVGLVLHSSYRLTRKIADGGMGAIYEAAHVRLKKKSDAWGR